jgi:hypothetical protein
MIVAVIVACEVLFWVFIVAGLVARYVLRRQRLGGVLLAAAPLVDLILLTASVIDLRAGGTATMAHALAAIYIGGSVAFGHSMIRWADVRFAHRFAGGPAPTPKPKYGRAHAAYERKAFARHVLAWAIGCGLLGAAILLIGDVSRTEALFNTARLWTLVLAIDGAISLSYTFSPKKPKPDDVPSPEPQRVDAKG